MPQQTTPITQELLDEPHIAGRRIPVLTIAERVEGRGLEPRTVADRFNLSITDVYHALLYYHEHTREFETLRREREVLMDEIEADIERPEGVNPPNA